MCLICPSTFEYFGVRRGAPRRRRRGDKVFSLCSSSFFPLSRRGLEKVTGAINPLAGDSLHPLPGSSGSPGWVSSVCMCLGKGVGGGCVVVVFLALVAARRESERASERQRRRERARERGAAIAFQGQHIPQEPLLQKHTRAEKGGHCEQRGEPASEVRFPGVYAGDNREHAMGFVWHWVTGCNLP